MTAPKLPEGLEPVAWTERHTMASIKATASFGSVKLTDEHGAYDIDRPTFKCDRLVEAIIATRDAQWQAALLAQAAEKDAEIAALKGREGTIKDSLIVADAERYRWLRDPERGEARGRAPYVGIDNDDDYPNRWALFGSEADAAIDSALLAAKEAK